MKQIEAYHISRSLGLPILGICRGEQLINVAEGGSLYQDFSEVHVPDGFDPVNHGVYDNPEVPCHEVLLDPKTNLFKLFGKSQIIVNSTHHQMVHNIGKHLRPAARAFDGVIEAIESTDGSWTLGVQWHPEMLIRKSDDFLCIFKKLVEEASKVHPKSQ